VRSGILNGAALAIALVLIAAGGPWLVRELQSLPRGALTARSSQRVVTLEVGGMHCSGCSSAVKRELARLDGVAAVDVRLPERRAYVVCERGVADTALTAAVSRAGPGFLASVVTK
jgi:copper chaperone CopZ